MHYVKLLSTVWVFQRVPHTHHHDESSLTGIDFLCDTSLPLNHLTYHHTRTYPHTGFHPHVILTIRLSINIWVIDHTMIHDHCHGYVWSLYHVLSSSCYSEWHYNKLFDCRMNHSLSLPVTCSTQVKHRKQISFAADLYPISAKMDLRCAKWKNQFEDQHHLFLKKYGILWLWPPPSNSDN